MPDHSQSQTDLDQAFHEYLLLVDRQEAVDTAEFIQRYPELAELLSELIETATAVERMAGPRLSESTAESARSDPVSEDTVIGRHSLANVNSISAESLSGVCVGDYELFEELGRGGMGVVYRARQTEMDRDVAFKMIRSGCLASENDVQRFYLEARAAGRLKHPSIVPVYQVGEIEGHHYFSMEYIAGDNLAKYARREQLSPHEIAGLLQQIADAIDYAHQQGVLHRDLKPSNILVDSAGTPRITDFGLAKDMHSSEDLTSSGSTVGTPSYMPPEQAQARRDEITCRSDVYSLGAILYTLLTGQPPFRADSILDTMLAVVHSDPVPLRQLNAECPADLESICLKCLQKDPADRYETARELADDLDRFVEGETVTARRRHVFRRIWRWLRNVPIVAAALGRRVTDPTSWQVRSQWMAIFGLVVLCGGIILWPAFVESQRLRVIDIATGSARGTYADIGEDLQQRLTVITEGEVLTHVSAGAIESRDRLLTGEVDIAFTQENALHTHKLRVLAPLYREVTLVLVRRESDLREMTDLPGRRIALGPEDSGMRLNSRRILEHYDLRVEQLLDYDRKYTDLADDRKLEGAIVTIKLDDASLAGLLVTGEFRHIPIDDADEIAGFRNQNVSSTELPAGLNPEDGLHLPVTFAVLAVRERTPDWFVNDCLRALYESDAGASDRIFSREDAAAWTGLNYHDAAAAYFSEPRDSP